MADINLTAETGETIILSAPDAIELRLEPVATTAITLSGGLTGPTGAGIPTGGTAGQLIKKNSSTPGDLDWDTVTQDEIIDGVTYKQYSDAEKTKLAAISGTNTGDQDLSAYETTTQLNARDTANRARTNHTGTQLAATISDFSAAADARIAAESSTGTGLNVRDTSPTLVTPNIGVATATSVNKLSITAPATSATFTLINGKTLTVNNTLTFSGTDSTTMTFPGVTDTLAGLAAVQTITGAWTFNDAKLILAGATSGTSILKAAAAAGSTTFTLPTITGTIYATGNTDVSVADGGTGRSTSTTAYGLIAAGTTATGAHQTLAAGATTDILVGGGASALPAWTAATGTGSPVRATSPTLVTPALGTPASGVATNLTGTASGLTAGNVTTNANLTGHVTSTGNATVLGTFTLAQLSTAVSDANVARTDAAQTFTGVQTMVSPAITTPTGIVKGDVGLGNVDNTADTAKPVSTAQQTALDAKQPLDSDLTTLAGLTATTDNFIQSKSSVWASRTPTQVTADLPSFVGDSGSGGTKGLVPTPIAGDATKFLKGNGSWTTIPGGGDALVANPLSQFAATTSLQLKNTISDETGSGALVFGTSPAITTPTGIVKGDVGLGNVDNTSDASKPVSTATQTALDAKLALAGGTMSGDINMAQNDIINASTVYLDNGTDATIPVVSSDGVFKFKDHFKIWPDLDGDGDYDADIWSKDNMYVVAENAIHLRPDYIHPTENGRIIFRAVSGTNFIESGRSFDGSTKNDLVIGEYNGATTQWAIFDQSQGGWMGLGLAAAATPIAPLHVNNTDAATASAVYIKSTANTTARIAMAGSGTSSGSTVSVGANADDLILRAGSVNAIKITSTGIDAQTSKIVNVTNPTAAQDAATKTYVDSSHSTASTSYVVTDETTTSTSYADLATVQSVTATIGTSGMALVNFSAGLYNVAAVKRVSVAVSGASTVAASDNFSIRGDTVASSGTQGTHHLFTGLTAGSNTFTLKFKTASGTGRFFERRISVVPL